MDVIQEVKDDAQILYTKKDVTELLEKQKEQMIEKACREFCHNCTHEDNCEAYCYRYKNFFEAMKGE